MATPPPTFLARLADWWPGFSSPLVGIVALLLAGPYLDSHAEPRYLWVLGAAGFVGGGVLARWRRWPWHWLANGIGAGGVPVALVAVLNVKLHGPSTLYTEPVTARNLSYRHLPLPKANNLTVTFPSPVGGGPVEVPIELRDSTRAVRADSVRVGVAAGLFGPRVFTTFQLHQPD